MHKSDLIISDAPVNIPIIENICVPENLPIAPATSIEILEDVSLGNIFADDDDAFSSDSSDIENYLNLDASIVTTNDRKHALFAAALERP